jgi:two-component system NtrC family sensor kinase
MTLKTENTSDSKQRGPNMLLALALSLILTLTGGLFYRNGLVEERIAEGQVLANYLATAAATALQDGNIELLERLASSSKENGPVTSILFYQRKNAQIIAGQPPSAEQHKHDSLRTIVSAILSTEDPTLQTGQVEVIVSTSGIDRQFLSSLLLGFPLFAVLFYNLGKLFRSRRFSGVATSPPPVPAEKNETGLPQNDAPSMLNTSQAPASVPVAPLHQTENATWIRDLPDPDSGSMTSATILIVDDDRANRLVLRRGLQNHYRLLEAENGEECLQILDKEKVQLVLLDLMMPVMSGFEVLKYISDNPQKNFPNIVVLSALMDSQTITNVLSMGAADYLTKPFNMEEMLARVKTQLMLEQREMALEEIVNRRTEQLQLANRRLEETFQQLLQSEKMASIGQLAAGVAHEINNPIGYIFSNLNSLKDYMNDIQSLIHKYVELQEAVEHGAADVQKQLDETRQLQEKIDINYILSDIPELLGDTLDGAERVKNIVLNLKQFSRADDETLQEADINAGIESTLKVVWNELKYKCEIHRDFGQLPMTFCNLNQINQVFTNLLVNAAHAIEKKGNITIKTRHEGDDIVVSITDDGKGIPTENLSRLFDPFFTTKPVGEGTGLGLYLSYEIMQKHKGSISVDSKVGSGTTFTLKIPVVHSTD